MKKAIVLLLAIVMVISLAACGGQASSDADNASGDNISSGQTSEDKESTDGDNNGKVKYKEKGGIVYVNDEELTIDRLLELVENAEKPRYATYTENNTDYYFDNYSKTFYWYSSLDRDKVGLAYDMLSQCYYRLKILDSKVYIDSCNRENYLCKSLLDYSTDSSRANKSCVFTFELDGDYCKVKLTEPSYDGDGNCIKYFWINTKTNTLDKMTNYLKESRADELVEMVVTHTDEFALVEGEIYFPTTDYSGNAYKWYNTDLQAEFDAILEKGTYIDEHDLWPMKEENDFASVGTADFPADFDIEKIKSVMLSNEYLLSRYQPEVEESVTDEDGKNRTILELKGLQENYEDFSVWITDYTLENKVSIGIYFDNMPIYHTTQDNVRQVLVELLGEKAADALVYYPHTDKEFGVDKMYDAWFEITGNPTITVSRNLDHQTRNDMPAYYNGRFSISIQK